MRLSGASRATLWLAIEDYSGLWEVVWELKTLRADADEAELQREAAQVVSSLLAHGLIQLYRCEEPYGEMVQIPTSEASTVLTDLAAWWEPAKNGISVRVGATAAGEEAYEAVGACVHVLPDDPRP